MKTIILKPGKIYYYLSYNPYMPENLKIYKIKFEQYFNDHKSLIEVIEIYRDSKWSDLKHGSRIFAETWKIFDSLKDVKKKAAIALLEGTKNARNIFDNEYKVEE